MNKKDDFQLIKHIESVRVFKGYDILGKPALVFIFQKKPSFELNTAMIKSRIVQYEKEFRLFISLIKEEEEAIEIFDILTDDLLSSVENADSEDQILLVLSQRFVYWAEFFKQQRRTLNEKWIRGIIGELWFLEEKLAPYIGMDTAVKSWTGPDKANQDFITEDKKFEIKTKLGNSPTVKISNRNQLDKDMYLSVIGLTKSSEVAKDAIRLSILTENIKNKILSPETRQQFNQKLFDLDLITKETIKQYDEFSYTVDNMQLFYIDEAFPIIKHSDVPDSVITYSYDLLLNAIKDFEISEDEIWN
ncbi:PD-(D/E)XK motif protein [Aerococcus sp.]|uniref:PD-(D/E)XK motif protein n=1 Tax=Aerococcus sp. TaxID=1872398 RepID=UPI0025C4B59D|nr:PD-(D/E)XK motif protein [Aerococcus sp.]MBR2129728.1 PD-(D/E)XK motif protein [Aerococcus sp.]